MPGPPQIIKKTTPLLNKGHLGLLTTLGIPRRRQEKEQIGNHSARPTIRHNSYTFITCRIRTRCGYESRHTKQPAHFDPTETQTSAATFAAVTIYLSESGNEKDDGPVIDMREADGEATVGKG